MSILKPERYTPEKLSKLEEYVRTYAERGQPVEYEILVDGFKAVRRTSDPDMFTMFESFVGPNTRNMEVLLYIGNSNSNDKQTFTFKDDPEEALSGLEIQNRINDGIKKARRDWDFEHLEKENQEQKEYIGELEKEVDKLEKEIIEYKAKQSPLSGMIGELGASLVESLVKRNPKLLQSLPGGKALSGFMEDEDSKEDEQNDAKVSYKQAASDEESIQALKFVGFMKKSFPGQSFDKLMQIIDKLAADTSKVDTVLELLNDK
jgi:hypothetical protein